MKITQHVALRAIPQDDSPLAIEYECRVGLVRIQEELQRVAGFCELVVVEGSLPVARGEARVHEEVVARSERQVEGLGHAQHHGAAGSGSARLEERNVAGRDLGLQAQTELAETSSLPPLPE